MRFDDDVVHAICEYMKHDPTESSLTIVQGLTGDRTVTAAELTGFDSDGAEFDATSPSGTRQVRLPWSRQISERAEVRGELFALLDRAMDAFGSRAAD